MFSFQKLLYNVSSVKSTFSSNHTIRCLTIGPRDDPILDLGIDFSIDFNKRDDKKEVAMIKIFRYHKDIDMQPFFEWEFKVLPLIINWFERASLIDMPGNTGTNIESRKLSSVYQFVRGMPVLYVETRLRQELAEIKAAQA